MANSGLNAAIYLTNMNEVICMLPQKQELLQRQRQLSNTITKYT